MSKKHLIKKKDSDNAKGFLVQTTMNVLHIDAAEAKKRVEQIMKTDLLEEWGTAKQNQYGIDAFLSLPSLCFESVPAKLIAQKIKTELKIKYP